MTFETSVKKALPIVLAVLVSSFIFAASNLRINQVSAQSAMVTGINYLSSGNMFSESNATLNADFARFASDGIKHISMRLIWSTLEPSYNSQTCKLDPTVLKNDERVLAYAQKYGIGVNLDFWTHFQDVHWDMPSYVRSIFDIIRTSASRNLWLRYVSAVVSQLRAYSSIESWAILNEPFYSSRSDKLLMQQLFADEVAAIKKLDSRPVICRFTLSYTPASGAYDSSVYDLFDAFAITEYLDPSNPSDTRYNARWSYWDKTVADCKARGRPLWVIEFGDDTVNQEKARLYYQLSLQKFQAAGVAKAYSWAWQTRNAGSEVFNIYDDSKPKSAYYELAKYPAGNHTSPSDPPSPPSTIAPSLLFYDDFESGNFATWTGTKLSVGETRTVTSTQSYQGRFSARFTSNGGSGAEYAYCYKTLTSSADLYVKGNFYVSKSGADNNGDIFSFISLMAGNNVVANAGWKKTSGGLRWYLLIKNGANNLYAYSTTSPSLSKWYSVELHWKNGASTGLGELWIDGTRICTITNANTAYYGTVNQAFFGLTGINSCAITTIYADSIQIATNYI